jgi:hypothetical protein
MRSPMSIRRMAQISELAAPFAVEVAQSFGKGWVKFHDSEEFTRLVTLYGPMRHLQRAQGS